ncbi:Tripartite motif-containing protein 2-like [Oopsacas minuta]|uniref:Tripartite motif-containing protein 2-like n=1 Tax=Oopsacas minuta TaxID=111878 RepID=A0AAV7KLQ0_9METZ|nr:Tripartite motif-containing protein 2-like [Oopsacas minuta]
MLMETAIDGSNPFHSFDMIEGKIRTRFNIIIEKLLMRRDTILKNLAEVKIEYEKKDRSRKLSIEEMKECKKQMETMKADNASAQKFKNQCLEKLEKDLQEFEISVVPNLMFLCDSIEVERRIGNLGELLNASEFYKSKKLPVIHKGRKGCGLKEFDYPKGISLDIINHHIHIADSKNKRILIYTTHGEQISEITEGLSSPYGVVLANNPNELYVTDIAEHALFKFFIPNPTLIHKVTNFDKGREKFNVPKGIDIDSHNQVYIADSENDRIVVLGPRYELRSVIGVGILKGPLDVKVKYNKLVYVLDQSKERLHVFSMYGERENNRIDLTKMFAPIFLAFDNRDNLLVSDYHHGCINIYGQDGLLLHSLGKHGQGIGEFMRPTGVVITEEGRLIVLSQSLWYPLQIF